MSGSEADSKLILTAQDGWHPPIFGMGGSGSKSAESVVADTVDYSTNLSKDFTILRLHGGTLALVAGVAVSSLLFYMAYGIFNWKGTKMNQARPRAPQGEWTWRKERGRAGLPGGLRRSSGPPSLPLCFPGLFMRSSVKNAEKRQVMMCLEGTSNFCLCWSEERSGYWQQQKWI